MADGISVRSGTLDDSTASTNGLRIAAGDVSVSIDPSSVSGTITLQWSEDNSTWKDVETWSSPSADVTDVVTTGGGYLRFTSSISSGSANVVIAQDANVGL